MRNVLSRSSFVVVYPGCDFEENNGPKAIGVENASPINRKLPFRFANCWLGWLYVLVEHKPPYCMFQDVAKCYRYIEVGDPALNTAPGIQERWHKALKQTPATYCIGEKGLNRTAPPTSSRCRGCSRAAPHLTIVLTVVDVTVG